MNRAEITSMTVSTETYPRSYTEVEVGIVLIEETPMDINEAKKMICESFMRDLQKKGELEKLLESVIGGLESEFISDKTGKEG